MAEENDVETPVVVVERPKNRVGPGGVAGRPLPEAVIQRCVWEQKLDRKWKPLQVGYRGRIPQQEIIVLTRIRTDLYKAVVMNPTHARVRVAFGEGPNTVVAGFLDSGYVLTNMRAMGVIKWAQGRIPKKESIVGHFKILASPM